MDKPQKLKHYESMFIVKQSLNKEKIEEKIQSFKDNITKNGGEISSTFDMKTRTLAYQIQKEKTGYYYVVYFTIDSDKIAELTRVNNIDEDILRFIFIKYESKSELAHWSERSEMASKGQIDVKAPKREPRAPREYKPRDASSETKKSYTPTPTSSDKKESTDV